MNIDDFITKWGPGGPAYDLNERQGAQTYFLDLCNVLGVPQPSADVQAGAGADYTFEKNTLVLGAARGYADVFKRGAFAWENKAPGKDLTAALRQLQAYSLALDNPPLLVVCDRLNIHIHTQFTGHPSVTYQLMLADLTLPDKQNLLRRVWLDPDSFRPKITNRDITEKAARSFATLADNLRKRGPQTSPAKEAYAEQVAHFLTQTLFCFFAEDVGLLPGRMFERIVNARYDMDNKAGLLPSEKLTLSLTNLFGTMQHGGPFGADDIPWFNGGLFKAINVPKLEIIDVTELRNSAALNWSAIDVSIFGTLFERGLDPGKRSQLGAHYTDPATIERIIEPVVRRPLLQKWELLAPALKALLAKSTKKDDKHYKLANAQYVQFLDSLADFKILDPACGSGNFLFLGLKTLKDIEHLIITEAEKLGLERPIDLCCSPANMLGIELNEYAAELARVTVWIGELQWRMAHGYPFKRSPVLEPLDNIEHRDALLTWENGVASEAQWPKASVVIGNPPFLGGSKKRGELGNNYFEALKTVFKDRVPGGADLVTYWFDKARKEIVAQGLGAAGLVATQAIRAGSNRKILQAIVRDCRIFDAWADEEWVNDGAAVRVSLVSFGWGDCCFLNGAKVERVTAELGGNSAIDITLAQRLLENAHSSFEGTKKYGDFDIPGPLARQWLLQPNPHGLSNSQVVKPWRNGVDLARRPSDTWIIDFGTSMGLEAACLFQLPFTHVDLKVKPKRQDAAWWLHERPRPAMRACLAPIVRYIATPRVSKHRFFTFLETVILADTRLNVVSRADDVTFGILSSRLHEVWALNTCSWIGVGNDPIYNAKSCFETFPFPAGLTPADTAHQRTEALPSGALIPADQPEAAISASNQPSGQQIWAQAAPKKIVTNVTLRSVACRIAEAAKRLADLRSNWLNPPEWTQRVPEVTPLGMSASPYPDRILPKFGISEADAANLNKRTLTNLYNLRQAGKAAWLTNAHAELDEAVAVAYGWADYTSTMPEVEILSRLLALNLERSAAQTKVETRAEA